MNPNEYQRLAARTECDQNTAARRMQGLYPVSTRLNHAALGLTGEVGELCCAVEKWLYYGQPLDRVNITEELGDCLWYIALACNALDVSLSSVMQSNIAKLQQRYPEKYKSELAVEENRDRKAERRVLEK